MTTKTNTGAPKDTAPAVGVGAPAQPDPAPASDAPARAAETDVVHAAGADPDSVTRLAKHQLAAADPSGDEHAREQLDRAAHARRLVAERNDAAPERVAAIDAELAELGYTAPLPTTAAQRGEPAGRGTRQDRLRRTSPRS